MKKDLAHNGPPKSSLLFINNYKVLKEKRFLAFAPNEEEGLAFIARTSARRVLPTLAEEVQLN